MFVKTYNNKEVLSVHALLFFTIFCFLVDEKIKLQRPKAAILTLKMLTGSRL
jgi:hypothetical protein